MDKREISEEYAQMAAEIIEERKELAHIKFANITIIYLKSTHKKRGKGKKIYALCEKVQDKYKWGIPCDFTITVFEPNVVGFTEDQMKILLFHELLHVGVDDERLFIRPHDLEDFKQVIDEFGTDWSRVDE